MTLSELTKLNFRPAPRLPKIMAFAVLTDYMSELGLPMPEVEMLAESLQRSGTGVYHLDCKGNGYRERGETSGKEINEVEVVMMDFDIPMTPARAKIVELVRQHNVRDTNAPRVAGQDIKRSTRGILNRHYGSIGFFTGFAWDIIDQVTRGNWKWSQEPVLDESGALVLDTEGKPQFEQRATRAPLTPEDFLWMCTDVIVTAIRMMDAREKGTAYAWSAGLESKTINNLLQSNFQGKRVISGGYEIPSLSRYIRDLYELGVTVKEIQKRLRPWLRLWRITELLMEEGTEAKPDYKANFGNGVGRNVVIFDYLNKPENTNPLVHTAWLNQNKAVCVIVRRPSAHVAIFTRGIDFKSVRQLAGELEKWEPGDWTFENGGVIFNGSKSRPEVRPTRIPLFGDPDKSFAIFTKRHLRMQYHQPLPASKYASRS